MTDIAVTTQPFQAEDLSWDLTPPEGAFVIPGTLDVSLFVQAQHFANGFIPSGTAIGIKTSTGLWGPYLDSVATGLEVAKGLLRASIQVVNPTGSLKAKLGIAVLVHGVVSKSRLPFTASPPAGGGAIDANGQADLPLIYWAA